MLLRQLEYLTALAREGHFGRAAAACHVSQPALSSGIRKLETELDVQIVQRGQRYQGLTREGEQVLAWSQRILAERAELGVTLSGMREGLTGVLRIGAIPTALNVLSMFTTPLREKQPGVHFALRSMTSHEIVKSLNDFDIEVGMTYVDGEPLGNVRTLPLYRERYLFLTPEDGPFNGRDEISWAEAGSAPLCLLTSDMQNRRIIDGYLADAGVTVRPVVECDTVSAIYAHIDAMGLSSVIPHTWLHGPSRHAGMRVLRLPRPRRDFHVGFVLADHHRSSGLVRAFVEIAGEIDLHSLLSEPSPGEPSGLSEH